MSQEPVTVNITDDDVVNEGNRTVILSLNLVNSSNHLNIDIDNGIIKITITDDGKLLIV